MKKILLLVAIIATLLLTGCDSLKDKDIRDGFIKDIETLKSYYMEGTLKLTNNDDTYEYNVEVNYKAPDKYNVSLKNKSNDYEQIILKDSESVYVISPSINKSFKFQSDWPNNNSQSYLLSSVAKDLKDDAAYKFTEKDGNYIFTTKTNYPNNPNYVKQNIILDKNQKFKAIEVQDENNITYIQFEVKTLDYKAKIDDSLFNLDEVTKDFDKTKATNEELKENASSSEVKEKETNATETDNNLKQNESIENNKTTTNSQNNNVTENKETKEENENSKQKQEEASKIDENIFPLYLPTNTSLSDKEVIATNDGQRVIMTFSGDNPFILVQETIKPSKALEIIPTYGEPFMLVDTVGSLTETSYTWTSNGIEYYIVSDQMDKNEMLAVAKSINVVSAINQK